MKKYIIILITTLFLASCNDDFLDRSNFSFLTEDDAFSSYDRMFDYGAGTYTYLPDGYNHIGGALLAAATDEGVHTGTDISVQRLTNGSWSAFNSPEDRWGRLYTGINKANKFLKQVKNYKSLITNDTVTVDGRTQYNLKVEGMDRLIAEVHFLRAFFYFELVKRYGGVPIIESELNPQTDFSNIRRNSFDECMDYLLNDISVSIPGLKLSWVGYLSNRNLGRATKGAAMALRTRALLYAASPLNNVSNDPQKWLTAANSAREIIDLNIYQLDNDYKSLFNYKINEEVIFERKYEASNNLEKTLYPIGYEGAVGGFNPSQNQVDAYETVNGKKITEDPEYDPQKPYENRDPRLTMSILVNGSHYKGRNVQPWVGGLDGPPKNRATRTGYYLQKFAYENLDLLLGQTSTRNWIYYRYAEVLLSYAEALNEFSGPDIIPVGFNAQHTARWALNQVRSRSGVDMPPISSESVSGQDMFREAVRHERQIELAFEEHRFWDLRRWKQTLKLKEPIRGTIVRKNANGVFLYEYPMSPVEERIFADNMYLYPILRSEIDKSGQALLQNPGW